MPIDEEERLRLKRLARVHLPYSDLSDGIPAGFLDQFCSTIKCVLFSYGVKVDELEARFRVLSTSPGWWTIHLRVKLGNFETFFKFRRKARSSIIDPVVLRSSLCQVILDRLEEHGIAYRDQKKGLAMMEAEYDRRYRKAQ